MKRLAVIAFLLCGSARGQDAAPLFAVLAGASVSTFNPAILNPIAWYKADGNATDAQGNYNGTWIGTATYTNGINGQAFAMTAQDRRILTGVIAAMPTAAGTVCFWVRPNWNENDGAAHYYFDTYGGSNARFYTFKNTANNTETIHGSAAIDYTAGTWTHIAYVYGVNKIYANGVEVGDFANGGISSGATALYIGHRYTGTSQSALASIDDFMVFTNSLTATQIAQIYNWRQ